MPLVKGASREAISENIRRERRAGRSEEQAVAIALEEARRTDPGHAPPRPPRKRGCTGPACHIVYIGGKPYIVR